MIGPGPAATAFQPAFRDQPKQSRSGHDPQAVNLEHLQDRHGRRGGEQRRGVAISGRDRNAEHTVPIMMASRDWLGTNLIGLRNSFMIILLPRESAGSKPIAPAGSRQQRRGLQCRSHGDSGDGVDANIF